MATKKATKKAPLSEKQIQALKSKEVKLANDIANNEEKIAKKKEEIKDLTAKISEKKKELKVVKKSIS